MVAYFFGKELGDARTGLVASILMAIVPGYISRSVAGSYDNEAVAIFALLATFYLWVTGAAGQQGCGSPCGAVLTALLFQTCNAASLRRAACPAGPLQVLPMAALVARG